jgi:hypothetical protein
MQKLPPVTQINQRGGDMADATEVKPGVKVEFRGKEFTVARVLTWDGPHGTRWLSFHEQLHTEEMPEIATVTVVKCG